MPVGQDDILPLAGYNPIPARAHVTPESITNSLNNLIQQINGQIAVLNAAISGSVSGVSSFNTRIGAVVLNTTDVTNAGGITSTGGTITGTLDVTGGVLKVHTGTTGVGTTNAASETYVLNNLGTQLGNYLPLTGGTINPDLTVMGHLSVFGQLTAAPSTLGSINNTTIGGGGVPAAGTFTNLTSPSVSLTGGTIDNTVIGATTPAATSVTSLNGGPLAGMRNRIINGDMRIDQRNTGGGVAAAPTGTFVTDRTLLACSPGGHLNVGNVTSGGLAGFPRALTANVATAYTPAATDFNIFMQKVEGYNIVDLSWGTAGAQAVMLSFWVKTTIAGLHSGIVQNFNNTRTYPFSFTVAASNTWQMVAIPIPGDTAGTWNTDNTVGLQVAFNLGSGATLLGSAGAWAAANYVGATGSVQLVTTAAAAFTITGLQLELGTVATPFERRLYGAELALCQRYYQNYTSASVSAIQVNGYGAAAGATILQNWNFPTMRIVPSYSIIGTWTNVNCGGLVLNPLATSSALFYIVATAIGASSTRNPANGGFDLSAEL
jgi:hypothetical protein